MKQLIAALALAVTFVSAAIAQERAEFKGMPLGAPFNTFRTANPAFWCNDYECTLPFSNHPVYHCEKMKRQRPGGGADPECLIEIAKASTYANRPARLRATFRDGMLSEGSANFAPDNYAPIVEALTTRYGQPASKRTEIVQNRMGATFQNEIAHWNIGGDQIIAMKYGTDLTRGLVSIMDEQEVRRRSEAEQKKRKSAPSDL
jgi:hypothetical protein